MPIRLNLLAEQQEAEEARRKDPVKRSIWLGGFLIALMLLYGLYLFLKVASAAGELKSKEKSLANMQEKFVDATNILANIREIDEKIEKLNTYVSNRFLWGSTLNAFQYTMVPDVQITKFASQQEFKKDQIVKTNTEMQIIAYFRGAKVVSPLGFTNNITNGIKFTVGNTNGAYTNVTIAGANVSWYKWWSKPPALTNAPTVIQDKTPIVREQIKLTFNGKVFGDKPVQVGDTFRAAITNNPYLRLLVKADGVNFTGGLDSPKTDEKETNRLSSTFILECVLADQIRR